MQWSNSLSRRHTKHTDYSRTQRTHALPTLQQSPPVGFPTHRKPKPYGFPPTPSIAQLRPPSPCPPTNPPVPPPPHSSKRGTTPRAGRAVFSKTHIPVDTVIWRAPDLTLSVLPARIQTRSMRQPVSGMSTGAASLYGSERGGMRFATRGVRGVGERGRGAWMGWVWQLGRG